MSRLLGPFFYGIWADYSDIASELAFVKSPLICLLLVASSSLFICVNAFESCSYCLLFFLEGLDPNGSEGGIPVNFNL